jgi:excisionase family DNA binding protein
MQMQILLHSKRDAARLLGISERTLHTMLDTGQLSARRCGSRVLIPYEEIVKFTKHDHQTTPPRTPGRYRGRRVVGNGQKRRVRHGAGLEDRD